MPPRRRGRNPWAQPSRHYSWSWARFPCCARAAGRPDASKLQPELHLGLMALEIDEVQRAGNIRGAAGDLRAPGRDHPQAFRQPRIKRRAEEERLSGEFFESKSL